MGNNAIVFGDSYSTFKGYIPEGYAVYYSQEGSGETDVASVSETWWHQVMKGADLNLLLNNSWSGSTICYTGYNNVDCSKTSSFIYRLRLLIEEGFFKENKIDKVFVFGGTNDNWANAPLGEMKWDGWKEEDLYSVLPAICYFMNLLRETLPQAKIYCLINTELKPEIEECLKKASLHNKITPVDFADIDKRGGHPTVKGMKDIKDIVLKCL